MTAQPGISVTERVTAPAPARNPRRTAFLDYDGTFATGSVVPPAHLDAVDAARALGHRVLLCTGRPRSMVSDALAARLDGVVALAGGYVEVGGRVLVDTTYPPEVARRTVATLRGAGALFTAEATAELYGSAQTVAHVRGLADVVQDPGSALHDVLRVHRTIADDDPLPPFGKVFCWYSPVALPDLVRQIGPEVDVIPASLREAGGYAGEIFLAGVSKAVGVAEVVRHAGLDPADVVAVGDGYNDLEMLQVAGTAIAVEGAPAPVLAAAHHVVPGPQQEGVVTALRLAGMLDD